jgi:hypothetical protein
MAIHIQMSILSEGWNLMLQCLSPLAGERDTPLRTVKHLADRRRTDLGVHTKQVVVLLRYSSVQQVLLRRKLGRK